MFAIYDKIFYNFEILLIHSTSSHMTTSQHTWKSGTDRPQDMSPLGESTKQADMTPYELDQHYAKSNRRMQTITTIAAFAILAAGIAVALYLNSIT